MKIFNVRKNQLYDAAALRGRLGRPARPGRRFSDLVGDSVDNIRRRAAGRAQSGPRVAGKVRHARRACCCTPANCPPASGSRICSTPGRACSTAGGWWRWSGTCRWRSIGRPAASTPAATPRQLAELCAEFGFRGLAEKLGAPGGRNERSQPAVPATSPIRAADRKRLPSLVRNRPADPRPRPAEADWVENYQTIDTPEKLAEFVALLAPAAGYRLRHRNDAHLAQLGRVGRLFVLLAGRRGLLLAAARAGRRAAFGCRAGAGRAARGAGKPGREKSRAESEVRHDRAALGRHQAGRRRVRHDDRQLSARCRRAQPQPGRVVQALPESHHDQDQRADRQRQEPEADGRSAGRRWSPATRPKMPTSPGGCGRSSKRACARADCIELFGTVEMPLVEVLVEMESNGITDRRGATGRVVDALRRTARRSGTADLRPGRPAVQHRLAQAIAAGAVRRAEAADAQADQDRRQHRRGSAGRAGPASSAAGQDHRISPIRQAEEHVYRRLAAIDCAAHPAACTPRSIRWWRPRAD